MIIEYTYSPEDLKKKCYGCYWFKSYDNFGFNGKCDCKENKIKFRDRSVTDRACTFKRTQPPEKQKGRERNG